MKPRTILVALVALAMVVWAVSMMMTANGFSARNQPTAAERVVARLARHWAVPRRAHLTPNPVPFSAEVLTEATAHFADHCALCHGNDGSGRTTMGQNLYPKVPDMRLADTQRLTDGELYWIIENGVRLTGMPAFGSGQGNDTDTWKLVHLIRRLNELTPEQVKAMEALNPRSPAELEEERADQQFLAGQDDTKEKPK
jgi:mono/diheme cytochrome c family protein